MDWSLLHNSFAHFSNKIESLLGAKLAPKIQMIFVLCLNISQMMRCFKTALKIVSLNKLQGCNPIFAEQYDLG